jgi:hypothetical protein
MRRDFRIYVENASERLKRIEHFTKPRQKKPELSKETSQRLDTETQVVGEVIILYVVQEFWRSLSHIASNYGGLDWPPVRQLAPQRS